ncbi:hypothetical protein [Thiolapillus sp.]
MNSNIKTMAICNDCQPADGKKNRLKKHPMFFSCIEMCSMVPGGQGINCHRLNILTRQQYMSYSAVVPPAG